MDSSRTVREFLEARRELRQLVSDATRLAGPTVGQLGGDTGLLRWLPAGDILAGLRSLGGRRSRSVVFLLGSLQVRFVMNSPLQDAIPDVSTLDRPAESTIAVPAIELSTDCLMQSLYHDLRCLARVVVRGESAGQTLQPTALVHEVFLRLQSQTHWQSTQHFYASAAVTMRRILVDQARLKGRKMRRGNLPCEVPQSFSLFLTDKAAHELIDLDETLEALQKVDTLAAQIAELRVFTGLTLNEVAELLNISPSRAYREWSFARAWLKSQISTAEA